MDDEPGVLAHLQALADPTRARLLLVLDRHELTVGELCQVLQLPQSTVSRHLRTLVDEGWLAARADGARRLYRAAQLEGTRQALWKLVGEGVAGGAAARQDALRVPAVLALRREASESFFDGAAGEWDALRAELFGQSAGLHPLLALLDEEWTVGDLGCGTGELMAALAPFVRRVVGVDSSPAMLAAARDRLARQPHAGSGGGGAAELRAGDLEALPVADGELDAAILSLVLHHVAEPAAVLAEARRVLAPGGRLLVVDMLPHARAEYRQTMGHVWQGFEPGQLRGWLEDAGLARVRVAPLPVDARAAGPALFVATAVAATAVAATAVTEGSAPPAANCHHPHPTPARQRHAPRRAV